MYSGGIQIGGAGGGSHSVTSGDTASSKSSEFGAGKLLDPFRAGAALYCLAPPGHISSVHRARKVGARIGMNVTAHQEKKKNEETKKGRRKEKEKTGDRF